MGTDKHGMMTGDLPWRDWMETGERKWRQHDVILENKSWSCKIA